MRPLARYFTVAGLLLLAGYLSWPSQRPELASATPAPPPASSALPPKPGTAPDSSDSGRPGAAARATSSADLAGGSIFAQFEAWTARYLAADPARRAEFLSEGIALATSRRTALAGLIPLQPREALDRAVPMVVRQDLPAAVVALLEERVNSRAFFGVKAAVTEDGTPITPIRREVRFEDGRYYDAFVYGRRATQKTTERAFVSGIAVDRAMVLDERPLRVLEGGERPDVSKPTVETCVVSGKSTVAPRDDAGQLPPVTEETPAVEIAGTIHYLCSGGHILAAEDDLIAQEGSTGGPTKPTGSIPGSTSTGVRSLLWMRVAFPETNQDPQTEAASYEEMRQVNDFFVENSFGNVYVQTTVTPLLIMPKTEAWYKVGDNDGAVLNDARAVAKAAGYDTAGYDLDAVIYRGGPGSFGGQAYVGSKGCWLKSSSVGVAAHEFGHNFGLWHANFWNTSGRSVIGDGSHVEYGNSFDTMGAASAGNNHFNAEHKNELDWMRDEFVQDARQSGVYRIFTMDQSRLEPARRYGLKVRKDSDRDYWCELRQKFSSNAWMMSGLSLNWSPWAQSAGGAHLLDTTPGSPDDKTDSSLTIGRTFSDPYAGVHITPIGKGGTIPESMDVVVNLGTFPGNLAPIASVSASAVTVATNAAVTFTAAASDADGDALSYAWDFGDKSFSIANAAVVTKSWATAGEYVVRGVVSDMKGGTASDSVVVRVGSPSTFRISGTVTLNGQPLPNVRVHNGLTGSSYRGSFTDSDGTYTIAGLSGASYNVTGSLYGYSFSTQSPTVGPSATGVNLTATETAKVTLSIPDADCRETGANPGTFRLTRTGSTAAALVINLFNPSGTASRSSDYTMAPDVTAANSLYTLTIPAGAATLDAVITPTDDSTGEGPETVTLELLPGTGYLLGEGSTSTLVITDSDSSLPVVSFRRVDLSATEAGDPAHFTISRTGATTGSLSVPFTLATGTGTASNGTDYATIGTSIVIPAGSSSVNLTINPLQDTALEGSESVTVTVSTNAAYIRDSSANNGTVYIEDDDQPVVSIAASDPAASEAGPDPATFVVTRTGNIAGPLTVHYALGGSALHGTDYLPLPGVLTIPAGATVASFTITPVDDAIGEAQQTIVAQLRGGTGYVVGTLGIATANLVDDDAPVVTVSVSDGSVSEPSATGSFRFTTTGTGSGTITVRYTVTGTAASGVDYQALTGTVSIGRNTTADITVTPISDEIAEPIETITVSIDPDPAYSTHLDTSATMLLQDDEAPVIHVSTSDTSLSEAAGDGTFYISRLGATTAALTVNYTMSGSATNGTDYQTLSGSMEISAGTSGRDLVVTPIQDAALEGAETITLTLANGSYTKGLSTATLYLPDDDSVPVQVRFGSASASGAESAGTINVPVTLNNSSTGTVTVEYRINGGTATKGVDFDFDSGVLTFAPGETAKTVPLVILDDAFIEANQTVILQLLNPSGAALGTSGFTFTINDNDTVPTPTVGFAATASNGLESVASPALVVSLSAVQSGPVTVHYAVTGGSALSGTDFTLAAGTLTFAAGETARIIPCSIVDDTISESGETIIVTIDSPTLAVLGPNVSHTFTITDNDASTVTIAANDPNATESGDQGVITVTRAGGTSAALTVNLDLSGTAINGADYQTLASTVSFPAGQASVAVQVKPYFDGLFDGDETVVATLQAGAGYTVGASNSATVTISENATLITIAATDATAAEAGSEPGVFTISRLGDATEPVAVNVTLTGTATSASDYTTSTIPVALGAGVSSATIVITPQDDTSPEVAETVIATLGAGTGYVVGAPSTATITISDDDSNFPPTIALDSPAKTTVAIPTGVGFLIETTVDDDGKPLNPGTVTTTWTKQSGPGTVTFGSATQADTTALFSIAGVYVLRLTASDGDQQTTQEVTVQVGGAPPFTALNINNSTPTGSFTLNSGTYTVVGGGANITGASDQFYFLQQALTGDGEIRARVVSVTGGASSAKAGVMFRESAAAGARLAYASIYGPASTSNAYSWRTRATTDAAIVNSGTGGAPAYPRWFRVVRSGSSFSGYTSTDGQQWTQMGSTQTVSATASMMAGLAVTSNSTTTSCTAVFDNVSLSNWPANLGATVNAGTDQTIVLPAIAALTGTVSDDAKPQPPGAVTLAWSQVSGPGLATFGTPAAASTTCTLSAPGSYVLRLVADDGEVKTFDDVGLSTSQSAVTVTASDPTAAEQGLSPAAFILSRTGSTTSALTVHFTLSGTASDGEDFESLGEEIEIPAGQSSRTLTLEPLADGLAEGGESATLTVIANPAYVVGDPDEASATIVDLPMDAWRYDTFGADANNPQIAGDLIDIEPDGLANVLEYGLGLSPDSPNPSPVIVGMEPGFVTLTYPRALAATDLLFEVQAAPTPGAWSPATPSEEIMNDNGIIRVIKARVPLNGATEKYLRLQVTRP